MSTLPVLPALLPLLLLGACAGIQSVVPNQSSLAEVRDRMGRPTDIHFDREGNELWEYATGPMGVQTYRIRAALDGRVLEITERITQERFESIIRGMTSKTEVRELLGAPSEVQYFGGEAVWSWRMRIGPQNGYYSVRFDRGGIVTERLLLIDAGRDSRDRDRGER